VNEEHFILFLSIYFLLIFLSFLQLFSFFF